MRDKAGKELAKSDEIRSSQATTSTAVSDNFDSSLETNTYINTRNGGSFENGTVVFDLREVDEKKRTAVDVINIPEKPGHESLFSNKSSLEESDTKLCHENGVQEGENSNCHGKQCRPKYRCCKCYSSRDLEPLLEQESVQSVNRINSKTEYQNVREKIELTATIPHAKTYPQNINCDACNYPPCFCGANNLGERKQAGDTEIKLKTITENHHGLYQSYKKIRKIFLALVVLDLLVIISMLVVFLTSPGPKPTPPDEDTPSYNICFDCADLEQDPDFSVQKLRGVEKKDDHCCFKSITYVYSSLQQMLLNQMEDNVKKLDNSLNYLQKHVVNKTGKGNFTIEGLLNLTTPKKKTAVHLISAGDPPAEEDSSMSGIFHKLRWTDDGDKTVLRKAIIWKGLNLQIQSEGYYFLYTRLLFKAKAEYGDVTVNYSINRQRGSTSTYIHEAKESCRTAGSSLEHSGVVEMVVHLTRNDEIFISVSKSDIKYLATEAGAHTFGLFEL